MTDFPKHGSIEWRIFQYKRAHEARRGKNYRYSDGAEFDELEAKGYVLHEQKFSFPSVAFEEVKRLRASGYFAQMFLVATAVRGCPDIYIYKKKKRFQI